MTMRAMLVALAIPAAAVAIGCNGKPLPVTPDPATARFVSIKVSGIGPFPRHDPVVIRGIGGESE